MTQYDIAGWEMAVGGCASVCVLYVGGWLGLAVYSEPELDVSDPLPDVDCCNIKVPCVNVTKWAQRARESQKERTEEKSEWDNEKCVGDPLCVSIGVG